MQSRKSLLAKIFGAFCALLCVIALAFGLAACDSNTETVKSVVGMTVENGQLVLEYSDGSTETIDLGDLSGEDGQDGQDGDDGEDGRGIVSVAADENGNLVITYTDGTTQTVEMPASSDEDCEHAHISWYKLEGYAYIASTNTYEGTLLEVCDDCGYAWLWKNEEHVGHHVWEEVPAVEPGCSTPGHTAGTVCEVCGAYGENTEEIPATGNHAWDGGHLIYSKGENVCEQGGQYIYLCTNDNCDAYKIEGQTKGHSVASLTTVVEPTADSVGYAEGVCTVCSTSDKPVTVRIELPKLTQENIYAEVGEDGELEVVNENGTYVHTAPTCDEEGKYVITIEKGDEFTIDGVVIDGETKVTYTGETAFTATFDDAAVGHTVTTPDGTVYIVSVTEYDSESGTVTVTIKDVNGKEIFHGNTIRSDMAIAEALHFFVNVPESCVDNDKGFQAYLQCDADPDHTMLVFYQVAHQHVETADGEIDYTYLPDSYTGTVKPSAPTCYIDEEHNGNGYAYCTVCGNVVEVEDSGIDHTGAYTVDEDGDVVYIEGKEPTCKENGYSLCKYGCGTELEVEGSALGHNIVIVGTPNIDQTADTFELSFYCTRGDLGSKDNPIDISGKYSELVANGTIVIHEGSPAVPTCDEENPFVIDINNLPYTEQDGTVTLINEDDITIMAGHSWPAESGLGYINEDYDGYAYNLDEVEDYIGNFVNVPPANCKETAYAFVYCDVCDAPVLISVRGTHQNTEVVEEANHDHPELRHCLDCGAYFYVGAPEAHTLVQLKEGEAGYIAPTLPTVDKTGVAYYKCSDEDCGKVVAIVLPKLDAEGTPADERVWTVTSTPATCESSGSTVYAAEFNGEYIVKYSYAEGGLVERQATVTVPVEFNFTQPIPARGHDEFVEGKTIVYSWYNPESEDGTAYVGYICTGCNRMMVLWSELEGTECPYEVDVKLESPQIPGIVFPPVDEPVDPDQPGEGGEETPEEPEETPAEPQSYEYDFATATSSVAEGTTLAQFTGKDNITSEGTLGTSNTDLRFANKHLKFSTDDGKVIVTLSNVKAGQTITVTVVGKSGSSGNPAELAISATNATTDATSSVITFEAEADYVTETLTFTATEDGSVVLTLNRNTGKTVQLQNLKVDVK